MTTDAEDSRLIALLDELVELLRGHGEEFWASWLEADVDRIRKRDFYGVRHFLHAFGGMGSFTDLYFHPANGNAESEDEAAYLNERFGALSGEAYRIARALAREYDAPA